MPKPGKLETQKTQKPEPKLSDFKAWRKRLRETSKEALKKKNKQRDTELQQHDRGANRFKVMCYRYCRELQKAGLIDSLGQYLEDHDGHQWKGHSDSAELWVLRLAAKDEQTDKKRKIRSRLSAELRLANANDVDPDLLLGFLYEVSPIKFIEMDASIEKAYDWATPFREG